jgi:hypothetical protein
MARVKGGYLAGIYDVPNKQPLDSRMLVTKKADLINPSVWKTSGSSTGEYGHYNGMIVAVNNDGVNNGVYYLTDRAAITEDNYAAYRNALAASEDVSFYFYMWIKLGSLDKILEVETNLKTLIGEIPEGKTVADMINEAAPSGGLTPVDGTIVIENTENGGKSIGVGIAPIDGNILKSVDGGLFVPAVSVEIAKDSHGLVAVDGALAINLATADSDGAMSKEDKAFIDSIPSTYATVAGINDVVHSYIDQHEIIDKVAALEEAISAMEEYYTWGDL